MSEKRESYLNINFADLCHLFAWTVINRGVLISGMKIIYRGVLISGVKIIYSGVLISGVKIIYRGVFISGVKIIYRGVFISGVKVYMQLFKAAVGGILFQECP